MPDSLQIQSCSVGAGKNWYVQGWGVFKKDPFMTVLVGLLLFVLPAVVAYVPFIGRFLGILASSFFTLGFYVYIKNLETNEEGNFRDVLVVFQDPSLFQRLWPYLLSSAVMSFIASQVSASTLPFSGLWGLMIYLFWVAATLYCLPLIYEGYSFVEAVRYSLEATHKNWLPFLLMGGVALLLLILSILPLALGLFIFIPLSHLAWYRSFKEIFLII